MNYDEQIEALEDQIQECERKILDLMAEEHAKNNINDISIGDKVLVHGDIYATVTDSKFVAANFCGHRYVHHVITCETSSGEVGNAQRCEVEKL